MQIKPLYVKATLCTLFAVLSAANANSSNGSYAKMKLSNVCLEMNRGRSYEILPTVDFYIIEVRTIDGKDLERIYIGYNPDVGDENRNLLSRQFYKMPENKRIANLTGTRSNQILGIPQDEKGFYFHIIPIEPSQSASNQASLAASKHGLTFC